MTSIRLGIAQLGPVVGDLSGNRDKAICAIDYFEQEDCDLIVFPELFVTGYPPEDLALKSGFVVDAQKCTQQIIAKTRKAAVILGTIWPSTSHDENPKAASGNEGIASLETLADKSSPVKIALNSLLVGSSGKILGKYDKRALPNYSVFDEKRVFAEGLTASPIVEVGGSFVYLAICEDFWALPELDMELNILKPNILLVINASPFYTDRIKQRLKRAQEVSKKYSIALCYVNMVGGQDELVFDGNSFVLDENSNLVYLANAFQERTDIVDLELKERKTLPKEGKSSGNFPKIVAISLRARPKRSTCENIVLPIDAELLQVYKALVTGTRDYVKKNGFEGALVGLSGGIDSSLVAAIATDALGPEHVTGILMPSIFTSQESIDDALQLGKNLGIKTHIIEIKDPHESFLRLLSPRIQDLGSSLANENLYSRLRGLILMALSNASNRVVLTTGNKSEIAVGYLTLYGDSAGGFGVLKDIFKTKVYQLARLKNQMSGYNVIPQNILLKEPSAELKENQKDSDSLPDYEILDSILKLYIEENLTALEIAERGYDIELVHKITRLVDRSEYKRRQMPPGVRVTPLAFGKDRRIPITNKYNGLL